MNKAARGPRRTMPTVEDGPPPLRRLADLVEAFLQREPADAGERQAGEDRDAGIEHAVGLGEGVIFASVPVAAAGSGTPHPVRAHGLAGPGGADLGGGVVANREDEIHVRRIRAPEVAFRARLR